MIDFDTKKHVFAKAHIHWLLREENLKMLNKNVIVDLTNTDWKLLEEQKENLIVLIENHHMGELNGLVHFLDNIQDQAAQQLGEETVFGKL